MLKKILLSSTIVGFAALPVQAADFTPIADAPMVEDVSGLLLSGVADLWIGYGWIDQTDGDGDNDLIDDDGRIAGQALFNLPLGDRFSAQFDAAGEANFDPNNGSGTSDYEGLVQGGLHISYRDSSSYLIGAFAGVGEAFIRGEDDETGWMVGAEGQLYMGNTTLYAQGGYFDSDGNDSETLTEALFVRGNARHFLSPNTMVSLDGIFGRGEENANGNDDITFAGWELSLRHQYGESPVSVFAAYEGHYFEVDESPSDDLYEHIAKVGVSIAFGASDLMMQDRYGATLSLPTEPLRAVGYSVDIVD